MTPVRSSGSRRLHAIEALRGFASGFVLLFHSLAAFEPAQLNPVLRAVHKFTQQGWLGVHMFFAISGWCIAERLAAAYRRDEPIAGFLRERALRIYPTYWAALALTFAVRVVAVPFNHTFLAASFPAGVRGWFADLFLVNRYLSAPATIIVSWSLVYELGFYLLGSGGLLLRRKFVSSSALAVLGLALCLWPLLGVNPRATYVLGLWPDFFAGALAWWAARSSSTGRARFVAAALVALLALVVTWPGGFGGEARVAALGTAASLWFLSKRERGAPPSGAMRALGWVGAFSYSLYLIHLAVLSPFTNLAGRIVAPSSLAFCGVWLAALLISLATGWALYHWVESPFERWRKSHWSNRPAENRAAT